MEKRINPFMKKNNSNSVSNNGNNRWNIIKEEVQQIEYDNRINERRENKFKNFNRKREHYSKFMRFTDRKEPVQETKPEFNLNTMKEQFPQLGEK